MFDACSHSFIIKSETEDVSFCHGGQLNTENDLFCGGQNITPCRQMFILFRTRWLLLSQKLAIALVIDFDSNYLCTLMQLCSDLLTAAQNFHAIVIRLVRSCDEDRASHILPGHEIQLAITLTLFPEGPWQGLVFQQYWNSIYPSNQEGSFHQEHCDIQKCLNSISLFCQITALLCNDRGNNALSVAFISIFMYVQPFV